MDDFSFKSFLQKKGFFILFLTFCLFSLILSLYYIFNWVAGKNEEEFVYPAGISYLGPEEKGADVVRRGDMVLGGGKWLEAGGNIYPYFFSYPEEMKLLSFPDDPLDSWGWEIEPGKAGENLIIFVESLDSYSFSYNDLKSGAEEFINAYPSFYSGLASVKSIEEFTNSKGTLGYKVVFVNTSGEAPNLDVFFPIPGDESHAVHLGSGKVPRPIFDSIIDSVWFKEE
jgi:hypothetical protein